MKINPKLLALILLILVVAVIIFINIPPSKKTFVNIDNSNDYITLNPADKTVFQHQGSLGNHTGTYKEMDTDYTFFIDDGSSRTYQKLDEKSICEVQTDKKYIDPVDPSTYIDFNLNDKTFTFVKYGISLGGNYEETDTSYMLSDTVQSIPVGLTITKIDNEHIGLHTILGTIEYVLVKVPIYKLES